MAIKKDEYLEAAAHKALSDPHIANQLSKMRGDMPLAFAYGMQNMLDILTEWHKIERHDGGIGFAKEECLDKMCENLPFIVYDHRYNDLEIVTYDNVGDMRGEIDRKPQYTHWRPIISPMPGL